MTVYEIVILVAMVGYAIFRQTQLHEVVGSTRFKLAIIYGIVGLAMGGYRLPNGRWEIIFLIVSLLLSMAVGLVRGKYTRVWADKGRVYSQGTAFTISLFVGLVVVKFTMGTLAYFNGLSDEGGFGEILLMIATMVAFQARIIWNRAQLLGARQRDTDPVTGADLDTRRAANADIDR